MSRMQLTPPGGAVSLGPARLSMAKDGRNDRQPLADVIIATGGRTYTLPTLPQILELPQIARISGRTRTSICITPRRAAPFQLS